MRPLLTTLSILLLFTIPTSAQSQDPTTFIPEPYKVAERYYADLNKDGQEDCVLIIKGTDKSKVVESRFGDTVDRNRRGIIVLFRDGSGYRLADKNYTCFSSEYEDGGVYYPPELNIEFRRENLVVYYAHGRYGFWKYIFRFQGSGFKLIGYDASSNRGPVIDRETSINFLTADKVIRKNTNQDAEGGDEVFKEYWSKVELDRLIELSEIEDFDELDVYRY